MNTETRYYMAYIESHEGRRNIVYRDVYGNKTIGVGHLVLATQSIENLNDDEVDELFAEDISKTIAATKRKILAFNSYPLYVRAAIVDGFFRGDLSGSPKTIKLINDGKWAEVSKEYLNNKEYKLAKQSKSGVWKRMLENSYHFTNYAEEIEGSMV
jgi:GH24 family phage-related lysozyme (muramidase)